MVCELCRTIKDGRNEKNSLLLSSLQKFKSKGIFDSSTFNTEVILCKQLLERNFHQNRTRKYFRYCHQLSKRAAELEVVLIEYTTDFQRIQSGLKNTCVHSEPCLNFLEKSKKMFDAIFFTQSYCLSVLHELQCYLANCEFVKLLVALIAVVSKLYSLINQAYKNVKKIINLLSHNKNKSTAQVANNDMVIKEEVDETLIKDFEEETEAPLIKEVEEDLGEVLSESELTGLTNDTQHCFASPISESCEMQSENLPHLVNKESTHQEKLWNHESQSTCLPKSRSRSSHNLKRPTFKVYKQRHPFIRKLARYSADYLQRDIPDYCISLYLSL